jgi:hypothetical protein
MRRRNYKVKSPIHRARARWQKRRQPIKRRAVFESLETRDMLTWLSLWVQDTYPAESFGPAGTFGELYRYGDTSEPLTVMLESSDETEALVPASVTIPANEDMVLFPIDLVDDTLLDGEQLVIITATAAEAEPGDGWLFVQDYETVDITVDENELSPGDTLTGTITISVAGNTEPVSVPLVSDRPDEIASFTIEVPVGQQSVDFEIPVTSNGIAEGLHAVQVAVPNETGLYGNPYRLLVSDPGVNTFQPADDGHARDADLDGQMFEQLTLTSTQITSQAASASGSFGEARGILEFDVSGIPSGATIHSALLTLQISGMSGTAPVSIDFVAFNGNGTVESADAVQSGANIGQLTVPLGIESLKSTPVILDTAILQSLVESGDYVGIVSKLAPPLANTGRSLSYHSAEHIYHYFRPSLHLVWSVSGGPAITANSLTIQEGYTVPVTSSDLAATDSDSDDASLVFTVSNVNRGQFLVNGSPATSFTQADIAAGAVMFEHDGSEFAPSYQVTVSDGTTSFGPQAATVNFTNVNDNPPIIAAGQEFQISDNSVIGSLVGSVDADDADLPGDLIGFTILAGNDDGVFGIDNDGNITIADNTHLDFETASQHVLTIAILDMVHWTSEEVTIHVIDEEEDEEIAPLLSIDYTEFHENLGASGVTWAHVSRVGEDLSQPWTVILTSSVPSKLNMPTEVTIPAYETTASFMIGVYDDTLFTGPQVVRVTARLVGGGSSFVDVTVLDVETVAIEFDDTTGSSGDTLYATVSATSTNRTEPLTILLESTRPQEIAPIAVVLEPSQQSVVVPVPITADDTPEGLHTVKVTVSAPGYEGDGQMLAPPGHTKWVDIFDPGVVTVFPVADHSATDADQDGQVFEQLSPFNYSIYSQAASLSGSFGETRGILEFDASSVPAGAIIESAVLTLDVWSAGDYPFVTNIILDAFAYQGNGVVESLDASQISNHVGQLSLETGGMFGLGSFPIVLDVNDVQSLVESGDYIGIVTKIQETVLSFNSVEDHRISSRPSLHLTLAYPPALATNALSLNEGETKTLTAGNLLATDTDSDESALTFTVSSVTGGQFLVGGASATSFTQAQIAAGQVAFAHDGGEAAPSFSVQVSDGTYSDGPQPASINFTNVNDNPPGVAPGQIFQIGENSVIDSVVGSVNASDADLPGDQLGFEIIAGNDDGVFAVDNNGLITVADNTLLDFETTGQYVLTIAASDLVHSSSEEVTINIVDEVDVVPVLTIEDTNLHESDGSSATFGQIVRQGGDFSRPLTVYLTSSDENKLSVPASVLFNPFETAVSFPIDVIDDTLLGGTQIVTVTAGIVSGATSAVDVTVHDVEIVTIELDQLSGGPGDSLQATITVSTTDRTEPLSVLVESTRPDEIVSIPVVIEPSQQSIVVPIWITADGTPEGLHPVIVSVSADGYNTYGSSDDSVLVEIADPGVVTILPADDGHATDTNVDGNVFETIVTQTPGILAHVASLSGGIGETRGILEFDTSSIPTNAIIESAVLTLDVNWAGNHPELNDAFMSVFAYQGNGVVESADANEIYNNVGQLWVQTDDDPIPASFPIPLDVADVQGLIDVGSQLGIVTKMLESLMQFYSKEHFRISSRPALHLTLAYAPSFVASTLTLNEGETKTLTVGDISASDPDSNDSELFFTVSNVTGGQFFVNGIPSTGFTQAHITAGQVAFAHDGGEAAPTFTVSVSDGIYSGGPQSAAINFTNVNDNAPQIAAGQAFSVSEAASNGTSVGAVSFSDADLPGDSFVITVAAGNIDGVFAVDNAGNLTVADNAQLDFESTNTYPLTISVFDGTHTTNKTITVNVLNVVETKFYVVDDGSANRTYEYEAPGTPIENYTLNSANTAPRGAASAVAGDRVWVVDNNRKVYVYNTSGGMLGSWTAGSLASNATPHGIATNGTDVWIVDDRSDKVFKYTGAASRLSGTQNAASSFNLNSSNGSPRDIVTDGASLWVVNDASTNKVFKYTVAGSLLGSWTIDSANSTPTGITIDPTNVSDIWIVDSSTDRVYQYVGAASRISGSESAATSFALAAGNTNPQGIADPPTPDATPYESSAFAPIDVQSDAASAAAILPIAVNTKLVTRKINAVARERFFESLATERWDTQFSPAHRQVFADSYVPNDNQSAIENHTDLDDAFESVLAKAFGIPGLELALS